MISVTDALIKEICPKTTHSSFCKRILTSYKGNPLIPKPITNVINNLQTHVKSTMKQIQALHDEARKQNKAILKLKYQLCNEKYAGAAKLVQGAVEGVMSGKFGAVKASTSNAMAQVRSCNEVLPKTGESSLKLLKDNNRWFIDLASIILVICDKIQ